MSKILAIKPVVTKAGKPMILIQTAASDLWLSPKQMQSKGCSVSLDSYVGGDIEADYYKMGDKLIDGTLCTTDNKLLKDFVISANPAVLANALAIESRMKFESMLDAGALFARNRAANVGTTFKPAEVAEVAQAGEPLNA